MNRNQRPIKTSITLASTLFAGLLMTGCASTSAPAPNIIQRVQGEMPAVPPPSGFLGSDYSLLTSPAEGSGQKAMLAYVNPNANFASYTAIIIDPVTYWADSDSSLPASDQQVLCNYFYGELTQE
ncbi:MAG: DUF3313 family protein, partial [Candidatus Binataceae bacterium]